MLCTSVPQAERFEETCRDRLTKKQWSAIRPRFGEVGRGVCFDDVSVALVNHRELFGHQRVRAAHQGFGVARPLRSLAELGDGDLVVHNDFGIARYLGMEMLQHTLVVDIGAGTVDLCRVHGAMPAEEDLRTLYKAGDHIDEKLLELVRERYENAQITVQMVRRYKEEHGFVSEIEQSVNVEFPIAGKPVSCDITEEIQKACESIVPEIMEMIGDLIATADPEFQGELRSNVIVAGGGSHITGLAAVIERELDGFGGGRVIVAEDSVYAGSNGALKLAVELPEEYWQQLE